MKLKVVIRVPVKDEKKRSKALKVAVGFAGVTSASLKGYDSIEIEGDGLDPVKLTMKIKKKMGAAELVLVQPKGGNEKDKWGGGKGDEKMKGGMMSMNPNQMNWPYMTPQHPFYPQPQYYPQQPYVLYETHDPNEGNCTIM